MSIFNKIRSYGIDGSLKALLKKLQSTIDRRQMVKTLMNNDFKVKFIHEGNIEITLPKFSYLEAILNLKNNPNKVYNYISRPIKEALLRKIVFNLYQTGYLKRNKYIIDIGCWIADNALVWAKLINEDSRVYAIDPSNENLVFGKKLAKLNNINNIEWIEAVCSDSNGDSLEYNGKIDHAKFYEIKKLTNKSLKSNKLDDLVNKRDINNIGLLHLDVEGFEFKVLKGSKEIVDQSRPVIIFEQHISKYDVYEIINYLKNKNYKIYMINEVLRGSMPDCRNFIAFDNDRKTIIKNQKKENDRDNGIYNACLGSELIEVD